jgi:RNA polymerase sigma-70 factor (ECF subfamily)
LPAVTSEQEREAASLMRLAQDGDRIAYASLLTLLTSVTRQFVRRHVGGSVMWVDDVVQETLLSVHSARQTYDARRPFGPWFFAIASNRMIDALRRERRVRSREVAGNELPDPGTRSAGMRRVEIDAEAIRAAVAALPTRQRDVIEGLKFQDQSVREVAGRMGMTESAVKVTAHRGYRTLKRLLGVGTRDD